MYFINPKYQKVKLLIHNINGRIVDLNGNGIEIPFPVSPTNPEGGSRLIPAATQEDLEWFIKQDGIQDIVLYKPDEVISATEKKKSQKSKTNANL